jgi:hypothetical protein
MYSDGSLLLVRNHYPLPLDNGIKGVTKMHDPYTHRYLCVNISTPLGEQDSDPIIVQLRTKSIMTRNTNNHESDLVPVG